MKTRLLILSSVVAAVAVVLWLKSVKEPDLPAAPVAAPSVSAPEESHTTVLLFADPREAGESCGCGEIIQMVRDQRGVAGVQVREIDSRNAGEDAQRYGVHTSPAVLLLDAAGDERARFEGESAATIASLRGALDGLGTTPAPHTP